jgi:excisionase family DNA binding protein
VKADQAQAIGAALQAFRTAADAMELLLRQPSEQAPAAPSVGTAGPRLLLHFEEGAEMIGASRTRIYELVKEGEIEAVTVPGAGRRIPVDALASYVERLRSDQRAPIALHRRRA